MCTHDAAAPCRVLLDTARRSRMSSSSQHPAFSKKGCLYSRLWAVTHALSVVNFLSSHRRRTQRSSAAFFTRRLPACTHGAGVRTCRCMACSTVTKGHPMHVFRRFPTRTAVSRTSEPMLRASTSDESRASSITASPCGVGSRGIGGSLSRRFRHPQASMA